MWSLRDKLTRPTLLTLCDYVQRTCGANLCYTHLPPLSSTSHTTHTTTQNMFCFKWYTANCYNQNCNYLIAAFCQMNAMAIIEFCDEESSATVYLGSAASSPTDGGLPAHPTTRPGSLSYAESWRDAVTHILSVSSEHGQCVESFLLVVPRDGRAQFTTADTLTYTSRSTGHRHIQ